MVTANAEKKDDKHSIIPITVTHPENVDIDKLQLFREPAWKLRLTIGDDRSYLRVKVVRAAPLSYPNQYISFLDGKDEEICMVNDLESLDQAARDLIAEELDRRYLTATIQSISAIRNEYGTSYWEVQTNRGQREFVVQNVSENAQWLGDHRLLIIDVDGNRFEIARLDKLDKKSLGLVEQVV